MYMLRSNTDADYPPHKALGSGNAGRESELPGRLDLSWMLKYVVESFVSSHLNSLRHTSGEFSPALHGRQNLFGNASFSKRNSQ